MYSVHLLISPPHTSLHTYFAYIISFSSRQCEIMKRWRPSLPASVTIFTLTALNNSSRTHGEYLELLLAEFCKIWHPTPADVGPLREGVAVARKTWLSLLHKQCSVSYANHRPSKTCILLRSDLYSLFTAWHVRVCEWVRTLVYGLSWHAGFVGEGRGLVCLLAVAISLPAGEPGEMEDWVSTQSAHMKEKERETARARQRERARGGRIRGEQRYQKLVARLFACSLIVY